MNVVLADFTELQNRAALGDFSEAEIAEAQRIEQADLEAAWEEEGQRLMTEWDLDAGPDYGPAQDINELARNASPKDDEDAVIIGLSYRGQMLLVAGEEGDGKSMFVDQAARELIRGDNVLRMFKAGPRGTNARVLYVDSEMGPDEVRRRAAEMNARGLAVPDDRMFYLDGSDGFDLGDDETIVRLLSGILRTNATVLVIDAGSNVVSKPREDEPVKRLFNVLRLVIANTSVEVVWIVVHLRKQPPGSNDARTFDDLFGSREWKGRSSKVLLLEKKRLSALKDRGGQFRSIAPTEGRPTLRVLRSGEANDSGRPFLLEFNPDADRIDKAEDAEKWCRKVINTLVKLGTGLSTTRLKEEAGVNGKRWKAVEEVLLSEEPRRVRVVEVDHGTRRDRTWHPLDADITNMSGPGLEMPENAATRSTKNKRRKTTTPEVTAP